METPTGPMNAAAPGMRRGAHTSCIFYLWNCHSWVLRQKNLSRDQELCIFKTKQRRLFVPSEPLRRVWPCFTSQVRGEMATGGISQATFFPRCSKLCSAWGKLSLHPLWDTAWYQRMNRQVLRLYGLTCSTLLSSWLPADLLA